MRCLYHVGKCLAEDSFVQIFNKHIPGTKLMPLVMDLTRPPLPLRVGTSTDESQQALLERAS